MLRVSKSDLHAGGTKLEKQTRPRQPSSDDKASGGLHNGQEREDTTTERRQREAHIGGVSDKAGNGQETEPLAAGRFGKLPNTKRAIDLTTWYWKEYGLVVVPAKLGDKHPLAPWSDIVSFQEAKNVWDFYTDNKGPLEFNYACLTGPSGVTVIDYDNKEVPILELDTFSVDTPRGRHQYLRVEGVEVGNSVNSERKIDIRGKGGVCILPGSQSADGSVYRLTNDSPIKTVGTEEWEKIIKELGLTNSSDVGERRNEVGWWASLFEATTEDGERNNTLTKLAGYLAHKELLLEDTDAIMYLWNQISCDPSLEQEEVDRTIRSVYNRHEREKKKHGDVQGYEEELNEARERPKNRFS